MVLRPIREDELKYDFIKLSLHGYSCSPNYYKMTQYYITIEAFHKQRYHDFVITNGNQSTRRRTNSPTLTRRRIKASRDVGEWVVKTAVVTSQLADGPTRRH